MSLLAFEEQRNKLKTKQTFAVDGIALQRKNNNKHFIGKPRKQFLVNMSARVVNRLAFTEFPKIRSPMKIRRPKSPTAMAKARIKRDLFGPVDRNDTRR